MGEIYLCAIPTVSGATDGKCKVYFAADQGTVDNWSSENSHRGPMTHSIGLDSVFGQDYQSAASDGQSSTSSSNYQDKVSLTTPALTGTYLVSWQARGENTGGSEHDLRLQNTTDDDTLSGPHHPKFDSSTEYLVSGFGEVVFTGSAKTFKIQYNSEGGTTKIWQARITIWRVG